MDQRDPTSPPTHFSVHAEFTISHPGVDNPRNRPRTSMERDETTGGVRMTYSWQPEWGSRAQSEHREPWPMSTSNSAKYVHTLPYPNLRNQIIVGRSITVTRPVPRPRSRPLVQYRPKSHPQAPCLTQTTLGDIKKEICFLRLHRHPKCRMSKRAATFQRVTLPQQWDVV